jgi:hypothetical protein
MPLEFVKNQKGGEHLCLHGYLYRKESSDDTTGKKVWKCTMYSISKCKSRVHTRNDEVITAPTDHNHAPDAAKIAKQKVITQMKEQAAAAPTVSTYQIVATIGLSQAVQGQLPTPACLKRTVQRVRQQVTGDKNIQDR